MNKKGLTFPELIIAVVVTVLFAIFLYKIIPITSYEWELRKGTPRETKEERDEPPFCSERNHIGTKKNYLGSVVYCDSKLKKWTKTVGFYSLSRAEIECSRLSYAGINNWRVPTWDELRNDFGTVFCSWPKGEVGMICLDCDTCYIESDLEYTHGPYWTSSGSNAEYKRTVWFNNGTVSEAHILQRLSMRCIEDKK